MSEPIHQQISFGALPQRVYETLLDEKLFNSFTAAPVSIDRKEGGAFICFGTFITGRNVELIPNQRIVQAWRVFNWNEGVYSIVKFELKQDGAGTLLTLDQTGFPEEHRTHLDRGWHIKYWEPLEKWLGNVS